MMRIYLFHTNFVEQKSISRDIEVPENMSLYDFAGAITDAYGFALDHCFGFFEKMGAWSYVDSHKRYELFTDLIEEGEDLEPTGAGSVKKQQSAKYGRSQLTL